MGAWDSFLTYTAANIVSFVKFHYIVFWGRSIHTHIFHQLSLHFLLLCLNCAGCVEAFSVRADTMASTLLTSMKFLCQTALLRRYLFGVICEF